MFRFIFFLFIFVASATIAPLARAEVYSPEECSAVGGACKRSIFSDNCEDTETEVASCNSGASTSCCKTMKDASGNIITGQAGLNAFQAELAAGNHQGALDAVHTNKRNDSSVPSSLDYQLLENIPGQENPESGLPGYIKAILNAALVLIVLSALFMISVGGFLYLTSAGNTSRASTAKGIIFDAILGLILALVSYLILYTINPDLVLLRISQLDTRTPEHLSGSGIPADQSPTGSAVPATGSSGDVYTHGEAVAALNAKGINVTSTGNCSDPKNMKCTSLENIPKSTIDSVINLKTQSGCGFNVQGGTETGHQTHGSGLPVVDLSEAACLDDFFRKNKSSLTSQFKITKICADQTNQAAALGCRYIEPRPHFHVQFAL